LNFSDYVFVTGFFHVRFNNFFGVVFSFITVFAQ
jgi:hypothetical protein